MSAVSILTIGHSFIARFKSDIWAEVRQTSSTVQEVTMLDREGIVPFYYGRSGLLISQISEYYHYIEKHRPQIVMIDVGSNDIGDHLVTPEKYATNIVNEAKNILGMHGVKLVVLCYAVMRNKVVYSIKPLEVLNTDIATFNHHILKNSRKNIKIIRWIHRGFNVLDEVVSMDGIHPDTTYGKKKYKKSLFAACKMTYKEMEDREHKTAAQIKRQIKRRRHQKIQQSIADLKAKHALKAELAAKTAV